MQIEATHKYPWKLEQFITIGFFIILTPLIWVFTQNFLTTAIVGVASVGLVIFLLVLNFSRLKKSVLHAKVDDNGVLSIDGNGYDGSKNRINVAKVGDIRWDKYTFHPTLILNTRSGGTGLKLPKRIALVEPLRQYLKDTLPEGAFVDPAAAETFDEIVGSGKVAAKVDRAAERVQRTVTNVSLADEQEKLGEVEGVGTDPEVPFSLIGTDGTVSPVVSAEAVEPVDTEPVVAVEVPVKRVQPKRAPKSKR